MKEYRQCNRCVMDTSAANILFDQNGNCNYCNDFLDKLSDNTSLVNRANELENFVTKIKKVGENKPYDCIVGLSGGADSSYTLHLVKDLGLRPLAVHMDNGWNSELAVDNIKNLVEKLNVDLHTHVIDWEEYKVLMQAFFDADVIDIELLYDNAMLAVNYEIANKYGIKYILAGSNTVTEGMTMPSNWSWYKRDKKNILNIAKTKDIKIQTFPIIGTIKEFLINRLIRRIKWVPFLDYFDYNKSEAMTFLKDNYAYKVYPYKHYESIFTRFYQGYILPQKFGVDKRLIHFSTLICSKQMTKKEALQKLKHIPYPSQQDLDDDIDYFLKKMGWTKDELDTYLNRLEKSHLDYGSERYIYNKIRSIYRKYLK